MLNTLGEVLPRAAALFGDKTALIFEGRAYSFNALDSLTNRFANGLQALGVEPGNRVSIYSGNALEWIASYHAALKCGAVVNPINVMLTPDEVRFVTNDCGARIIVAPLDKADALLSIKRDTPLEHVVVFGGSIAGSQSFDDLVARGQERFQPIKRLPADLSTIGYTSGTTGHPKGAMLSHRAVVLNSAMTANLHARTAADTVVTALPCAHVYGNVVMNGALLTGMTLVLMPRFDPVVALGLIEQHRATMFEGVPTMYMYMLNEPAIERHHLATLTRCTVGGQAMPVAKMEEAETRFGCPLLELWGMTEIAGLGTTHPVYGFNRHGSIGVPLPYVECRIAAVDDPGRSLAPEDVGELMVRGPIVMQGYFGNDRATTETIEPDGWMHTGDLARRDAEGYFYVVDRKKDMIITGGFNIYPAELERVIAAHPAVAMVAVGSQPDPLKGELAKAYVVPKTGASKDAESILMHCREHLAAYKVPRMIQFVDDLPKTSTGKVMRRELKNLDLRPD
ncbi:MAG: AMP-binding protein [Betaproteobacteria bacterium]|nr:AMP-binding protein [Betaproteobacteria bacterium]